MPHETTMGEGQHLMSSKGVIADLGSSSSYTATHLNEEKQHLAVNKTSNTGLHAEAMPLLEIEDTVWTKNRVLHSTHL